MTPIRPNPFPAPASPAQDPARTAAQRAFFDAALGRANASAPPAAAAPAPFAATSASPPVQRAQVMPDPAAPAPAKVLRPGSLLDIRV